MTSQSCILKVNFDESSFYKKNSPTEWRRGRLAKRGRAVRCCLLQPRQKDQHHPAALGRREHQRNGHTGIYTFHHLIIFNVWVIFFS